MCRSRWLRGLSRGSMTTRLLGLRVRIPPGVWMSVCCECCVLSGRGLFDGPITRPEESYRVSCVSMSVIDEPHRAMRKIKMKLNSILVDRYTFGTFYWSKTYIITKSLSGFRVDTRPQKDGGQTRLPHYVFSFHFMNNDKITSIFFLFFVIAVKWMMKFHSVAYHLQMPGPLVVCNPSHANKTLRKEA